jgi:hypothetical protein
LEKEGAIICFWRSDDRGLPSNGGGKIAPAAPGIVHTAPGPLNLCNAGTLHATLMPPKWKGERWWVVALTGEVVGDQEKYGCLSREIIGEAFMTVSHQRARLGMPARHIVILTSQVALVLAAGLVFLAVLVGR